MYGRVLKSGTVVFGGWLISLAILSGSAFGQTTPIAQGIASLSATQNVDGSWGTPSTLATSLHTTSTVLETLKILVAAPTPVANGEAWLAVQPVDTTRYAAWKVLALAGTSREVSAEVAWLLSAQNGDGSFGGAPGFTSDPFSTAVVMLALARVSGVTLTVLQNAGAYLLAIQNADGGWVMVENEGSNVYVTAYVLQALQTQTKTAALSTALSKGVAYLKGQQQATGSWGSVFETALAYLALVGLTTDATVLGGAGNYLLSTQLADGSWDQDPYSTALALRALKVFLETPVTPPPGPTTGNVTGTVVDALTQVPLAGVVVSLVGNPAMQTTTTLAGGFTLGGLAPGTIQLQLALAGYVTATVSVTVTAGNVVNVGTIPLSPVGTTGIIQGVITEAGTGAPLSGVLITVTGAATLSTTTGANGTYQFTGVPPGNVTLTASKAGYVTVAATGTVVGGGVLTFSPALSPGPTTGTIQGTATEAGTGAPLAGVTVAVTGAATLSATTGGDGTYLFTQVPPGTVTITASKSGYQTLTATGTVLAGAILTFNPALVPAGGPVPTTGTIQGTVTKAATGSPLAGATVNVTGAATLSATTGANGTYAFPNVPPGGVTLSAGKAGYTPVTATGIVAAGGILVFSPALQPAPTAGTLIGAVVDAATSSPITGATIEVQGTTLKATTDAAGKFTLPGVPTGTQVVVISAAGYVAQTFTLAVSAGVTYDFGTVRLTPAPTTSTVTGKVTDAVTTNPIAGATVSLVGGALSTTTDANGAYTLSGITVLSFDLRASAVGYSSQTVTVTLSAPGTATVDFTLSPAAPSVIRIVSLSADQPSYPSASDVQVSAVVENTGTTTIQVASFLDVIDPAGKVVQTLYENAHFQTGFQLFFEVGAGATREVGFKWNTGNYPPGMYQLRMYVVDTSQKVLAEKVIAITIRASAAMGGGVTLDPPLTPVDARLPVQTTATIKNLGNTPIPATSLQVTATLTKPGVINTPSNIVLTLFTEGSDLANTDNLVVDSAGNFYTPARTLAGYVLRIAPDGSLSRFVSGLSGPQGIAIDPANNLYVLTSNGAAITKISPSGAVSPVFSGLTQGQKLAVDPAGNFYVSQGNDSIAKVSPTGSLSILSSGGLSGPQGLVYDAAGNLYVANDKNQTIAKVTPQGTISTFVAGVQSPKGMARDGTGNLYVAEAGTGAILKITPSGTVTAFATGFLTPFGLTFDAAGNLYVSDQGDQTVSRITPAGAVTTIATSSGLYPVGLAYDAAGNLYVSNESAHTITKVTPQGTATLFASGLARPRGLAFDAAGNLYVANAQNNTISRITPSGSVSTFATGLISPYGMAFDPSGNLYVTNSGNNTIAKITPSGSVSAFATGLNGPRGVVGDGLGNLYVTNTYANAVLKFAPDGSSTVVATLTGPNWLARAADGMLFIGQSTGNLSKLPPGGAVSTVASGFNNLQGLALDGSGSLMAANNGNHTLSKVDPSGTVSLFAFALASPSGLAFDANGVLHIANAGSMGVVRLHPDGTKNLLVSDAARFPRTTVFTAIAFDPAGNFYGASYSRDYIQKIAPDGTFITFASKLSQLVGLVFAPDGHLMASNNAKSIVYRIAPDGSYAPFAFGLSSPRGLALDVSGYLFVANYGNGTVVQLAPDGTLTPFASGLVTPYSLTFGPSGDLFVASSGGEIYQITPGGIVTDLVDAALLLGATVTGIAPFPDGSLAVLNSGLRKVFRITLPRPPQPPPPGTVEWTKTVPFPGLGIEGSLELDLGSWIPNAAGEYTITVTPTDPAIAGELTGKLLVGSNATGTFAIGASLVNPGDPIIPGKIKVKGAETTNLSVTAPYANFLANSGITYGANGVVTDPLGNIFISGQGKIVKIDPAGQVSDFVTGLHIPSGLGSANGGMVRDSKGDIFIASNATGNPILKITPQGVVSPFVTTGSSLLRGMAIDSQDNIYYSTTGSLVAGDNLLKVSPSGVITPFLRVAQPSHLAVDDQDNLYVINAGTGTGWLNDGQVLKVTSRGEVIPIIRDIGFEREGRNIAAGCFDHLYFVPWNFPPYRTGYPEEDKILEYVGGTGEIQQVFYGPGIDKRLNDMDVIYFDRFQSRLIIWNDYYGPVFSVPVSCGSLSVEAHLILPGNITLLNPLPAPDAAVPLADGRTEYLWNLSNLGSTGVDLTFDLQFLSLSPGETRPAASEAFLAFQNTFTATPVKVPLAIPGVTANSLLALKVSTDQLSYPANTPVQITAEVTNQNPTPRDALLRLEIRDAGDILVESLPEIPFVNLAGNTTLPLTAVWNTGNFLAGAYKVVGTLFSFSGEEWAVHSTGFEITGGTGKPIEGAVSTDKASYNPHELVTVSARVTNLTPNRIFNQLAVLVTVTGPTGTVIFSETQTLTSLMPGEIRGLTFSFNLGAAPPGPYTVTLTVTDPATGAVLETKSVTFTVTSTAGTGAGLVGTIAPIPTVVYLGDSLTFNYTVKNAGNAAVANLGLKILLVDPDTGQAVLTLTDSVATLAVGAQVSRSQTQANLQVPLSVPSKAFLVVLQGVLSNGTVVPLAGISVTIKSAQVDLAITASEIAFSNPTPLRGETVTISATVRNLIAGAPVANVVVAFYLGGLSGTKLGEQTVPSLSGAATVQLLWDTAGLSGEQIITVVADPSNIIAEVSESNNVASQTIAVQTLGLKKTAAASSRILVWIAKQLGTNSTEETLARQALEALGLPYTVVHSKEEFATEFRKPLYSAYLLFNQGEPLTDKLDQELQEQVYWGKGLVATFWEQTESGGAGAPLRILGAQFEGYLPAAARTLSLSESPLGPAQTLPTEGKVEKLLLPAGATAQVVGTITDKGTQYPAVLLQPYGQGVAVFFAVDVGASAQGIPFASYQDLLQSALAHVVPANLPLLPLGAVTVTLEIQTPAIPIDLKIEEPLPSGLRLLDPGEWSVAVGEMLTATLSLPPHTMKTLTYTLELPLTIGDLTLESRVFTKAGDGSYRPYETVPLTVIVPEDWAAIRAAAHMTLQALVLPTKPAQQRQAQIVQTLQNMAPPTLTPPTPPTLWSQQIQSVLNALDDLAFIRQEVLQATPADAATLAALDGLRLDLDSLLLLYEALWAKWS